MRTVCLLAQGVRDGCVKPVLGLALIPEFPLLGAQALSAVLLGQGS